MFSVPKIVESLKVFHLSDAFLIRFLCISAKEPTRSRKMSIIISLTLSIENDSEIISLLKEYFKIFSKGLSRNLKVKKK